MSAEDKSGPDQLFARNAIDVFIRLGVLFMLIAYCLRIVEPFVNLTLWASILAVALFPMHLKLSAMLGGRSSLSATVLVLIGLMIMIVPVTLMTESTVDSAKELAGQLKAGELSIPPPPDKVANWPLIGEKLHQAWSGAATNLQATLNQFEPQLVAAGEWTLKAIGGLAGGLAAFVASIIIAGFLLVSAEPCYRWACRFLTVLAGSRGQSLTDLSVQTVRSVAKGVLGVAVIQTSLAAVGLVLMDVPGTGILVAVVLLIAIIQVPTLIVIGPLIVWVYSTAAAGPATIFAIYMVFVSLSDNFLKPMLLGRGVEIPTLIILIGAIGGMLAAGVIGLFLGAVVLAVGYELLLAWMNPESVEQTLAEIAEAEQ